VTDLPCHNAIDVTAILCTYNRSGLLASALESLAASRMPASVAWEVLVVDNNSSDRTRDVAHEFCQRDPEHFRYVFEPKQGLSYARNAGIANARGAVVAFTDDDVTVEPMWLQSITAGLRRGEGVGAGGRTLPAQTMTPPSWLPNNLADWGGIFCAYFDLGDRACKLDRAPFGANMAFRKSVFEKYGGFRTDLGRNPGDKIGNEDTEFGRRLIAVGESLKYEPSAIVYHPVPEGRLTKEFFYSWWFDYGRAMSRELGERRPLWGIPKDYVTLSRLVAEMPFRVLRWILAISPQNRFRNKCWVWHASGQITELHRRLVATRARKRDDHSGGGRVEPPHPVVHNKPV
jgi:glucosyl-dolichyl phosphate glucuronosyltransferase